MPDKEGYLIWMPLSGGYFRIKRRFAGNHSFFVPFLYAGRNVRHQVTMKVVHRFRRDYVVDSLIHGMKMVISTRTQLMDMNVRCRQGSEYNEGMS